MNVRDMIRELTDFEMSAELYLEVESSEETSGIDFRFSNLNKSDDKNITITADLDLDGYVMISRNTFSDMEDKIESLADELSEAKDEITELQSEIERLESSEESK